MSAESIQILVIDDDPIFRALARAILATAGYDVHEAADGRHGIASYRQLPIDLVITDIVMPGMEGFETILELRRISPHVKIIAVTGGERLLLKSAERFGAVLSLCKPVAREELLASVREVLGRSDARVEDGTSQADVRTNAPVQQTGRT
jgi:CheY-like chemotaxis protein